MQLVVAFFVLFSIFCSSHKKTYVSVYTYYIPPLVGNLCGDFSPGWVSSVLASSHKSIMKEALLES